MYVDAGELSKRIEIFRRELNRDTDGYGPDDEIPVLRCYAKYTQTSGSEVIKAGSDFSRQNVRFLIRWPRKELDTNMFVRYRTREYEIVYLNSYGDTREYLEIWCVREERGG